MKKYQLVTLLTASLVFSSVCADLPDETFDATPPLMEDTMPGGNANNDPAPEITIEEQTAPVEDNAVQPTTEEAAPAPADNG